jgi:hypothetical protein
MMMILLPYPVLVLRGREHLNKKEKSMKDFLTYLIAHAIIITVLGVISKFLLSWVFGYSVNPFEFMVLGYLGDITLHVDKMLSV